MRQTQYGWVCAQEPGRSCRIRKPGHQVGTDSWGKGQDQGQCAGTWDWQGKTAEPCTGGTLPSEAAWGRGEVEKEAGRGILGGEMSAGGG